MEQMMGKQSVRFQNPVKIASHACVGGKKEGEGPLGKRLDLVVEDPMFGQDNWEESESSFLKTAGEIALRKGKRKKQEVRMAFCGDLLGQLIASSFGVEKLGIPFYGVYGACSSIGAALSAGAMAVAGGFANLVLCAASSHFASAEKEFRFPLGYGSQRPFSATWTVTGAGAFLLNGEKGKVAVTGITTGKIKDFGVQDPFNMGACMAPAAADTIYQNLKDFGRKPEEYDRIITGDLGVIGQKILIKLLKENGIDAVKNHMDCGIEIFDGPEQDTHAGGSGCACSALVLSSLILPKLESGEWKRVLFVPTGALLSQVSANEGRTIPAIAHGVVLETV
ncbi:MAG: stage V sporulation protein AD [Eubacterium sp.]|nr:stage V sporulation protein AD [Eubacterium sp.]MDD7208883.1 stage V sporulation protein AD [Lachnospiraceae bacterium]MDY5496554.1 stage V sporulation protein AD [Anaerobutyricum sp.]